MVIQYFAINIRRIVVIGVVKLQDQKEDFETLNETLVGENMAEVSALRNQLAKEQEFGRQKEEEVSTGGRV